LFDALLTDHKSGKIRRPRRICRWPEEYLSGHGPERWPEFRRRYRAELRQHLELLEQIHNAIHKGPVTLIYASRDEKHNDAVVLRDLLSRKSAMR